MGTNMPESHVLPVLSNFLGCGSCSGNIWKKLPVVQKGEHAMSKSGHAGKIVKAGLRGSGKKWCLRAKTPYCSFI